MFARNLKYYVIIALSLFIISCGSSDGPNTRDPAELYALALKAYEDEDWFEAKSLFDIIKLQFTASEYADDAQFYLGKVEYNRKQYIVAAYNFNALLRNYPGSQYSKEALYMVSMCYYELSPNYDRDQNYTRKAIQSLQEFQYIYADDSLAVAAGEKIDILRNKLAHREYFTATLYMNMDAPRAAVIYFDEVLRSFEDTEFYEPAYFGKIEALVRMKKYDEARSTVSLFKQNFPQSSRIADAEALLSSINESN